jgi:hypothetical protein
MESHLRECSACSEKFENFKRLRELFKTDAVKDQQLEQEQSTKDKIWQNLYSRQQFNPNTANNRRISGIHSYGLWKRKLSIPLPAAAAAAIIITFMAAVGFRGGQANNDRFAYQQIEPYERTSFILASEDEMPGIIPTADINGILQFLTSDGTDVIILRLPESRSFYRTGEPEIIRAADFRRHP